jgi:hypothetical protein
MKILSVTLSPLVIKFLTYNQVREIKNAPDTKFALYKLHKYNTTIETLEEVTADFEQVLREQANPPIQCPEFISP